MEPRARPLTWRSSSRGAKAIRQLIADARGDSPSAYARLVGQPSQRHQARHARVSQVAGVLFDRDFDSSDRGGTSTAVFSVIDPLLFRPLPYPRDEQLVSVGYFGPIDTNEFNVVSSYLEWRRLQTPFQMLTSMRPASTCDLVAGGTPQQVACYGVEANFLRTFGITPDLGRDFAPQDDLPRAPTVILISHRLWQQVFGGDAQILGRTVTLNEEPVRIIGILPQTVRDASAG